MFDSIKDFIIHIVGITGMAMVVFAFSGLIVLLIMYIIGAEESTHKEHHCTQIENKELT